MNNDKRYSGGLSREDTLSNMDAIWVRARIVLMRGIILILILYGIFVTWVFFNAKDELTHNEAVKESLQALATGAAEKATEFKHLLEEKSAEAVNIAKQAEKKLRSQQAAARRVLANAATDPKVQAVGRFLHEKGSAAASMAISAEKSVQQALVDKITSLANVGTPDMEQRQAKTALAALAEAWANWEAAHPLPEGATARDMDETLEGLRHHGCCHAHHHDQKSSDEVTRQLISAKQAFDAAEDAWGKHIETAYEEWNSFEEIKQKTSGLQPKDCGIPFRDEPTPNIVSENHHSSVEPI